MNKIDGLDYELKYWIPRFGSNPVKRIAYEDFSASYEMDVIHVLELENGKYAVITECGCSCYGAEDADIEVLPTKEAAMEQFDKWVKERKRRAY